MRVLIVSDIHANYPALMAVLEREYYFDKLICLGDLVDYGPFPEKVINKIREISDLTIQGNHDFSLATGGDCGCSKEYLASTMASRKATYDKISIENIEYLKTLPKKYSLVIDGISYTFVHGSFKNPLYGFVAPYLPDNIIRKEMEGVPKGVLFFGHSHIQMNFVLNKSTLLVNPGSVGFPKTGDNRAAYVVVEDGDISFKKTHYDIGKTVEGIKNLNMPDSVKEELIFSLKEGR